MNVPIILRAFLAQTLITVCLDPSSPVSNISPSVVYALDLASVFTESGHLACTATLTIPTIGGCYYSHLHLVVGYNLPTDVVLGADWVLSCQPVLTNDHTALKRPDPHFFNAPPLLHHWYPIAGSFMILPCFRSTLISPLAPADVSQGIWGADRDAWDALSSLVNECCTSDMLCIDLLNDHELRNDHDSHDARRNAILVHLLNGMCASVSCSRSRLRSHLCKLLARDSASAAHLSYALCKLLLDAFQNKAIDLNTFSLCCTSVGLSARTTRPRHDLISQLQQQLKRWKPFIECGDVINTLNELDIFSIGTLIELVSLHGLGTDFSVKDVACDAIVLHIVTSACHCMDGELCYAVCSIPPRLSSSSLSSSSSNFSTTVDLQMHVLNRVRESANKKIFSRILCVLDIPHPMTHSIKAFRSTLRTHCSSLRVATKATRNCGQEPVLNPLDGCEVTLAAVAENWPQRVPHAEKASIIHDFRTLTSSSALKSFTCASCAEHVRNTKQCDICITDIDLGILRYPGPPVTLASDTICFSPPMPFADGPLHGVLVDPAGVLHQTDGSVSLLLCPPCKSALSRKKLPRFSLANLNVLGNVPSELSDLTLVEELIVSRCRAKLCVVKLQDHRDDVELPTVQRGIKGHVIVFPQHPETVSEVIPAPLNDIVTPICVIFCGSMRPSLQWLKEKARPLVVRREAVLKALQWLRTHNALYQDIVIDATRISALPEEDVLDYNIEHIPFSAVSHALVSRYDAPMETTSFSRDIPPSSDDQIQFEKVVITDVDAHAPSYQLKAAALRHAKRGGSFIEVPHDPHPVNEFFNPSMFPMLYPTLFPYGIGGFEDRRRAVPIGLENHVKHMLALADKRFQQHYSFMFVVFNVLQRRKLLLHTSLRVSQNNFDTWARRFACVSTEAINSLAAQTSTGFQPTPATDDERLALELMKEVRAISSNIPGSPESLLTRRNEIRATILSLGVPSFFITVNPADVYNPIIKFLTGNDIDIDNLLPNQVPTYWEQARAVAHNPCVPAEFFNTYINAFISAILRYDPKQRSSRPGILGVTKAYYGCVEAQGRGSLHCHMVVWVHGGLTSDEIRDRVIADHSWRDRLIEFLDDTVCNVIPADPDPLMSLQSSQHHPCAVRGVDMLMNPASEDTLKARLKDLRSVVLESQRHSHTSTCYKYHRSGNEKQCRFNLSEENVRSHTFFTEETGTLTMRHLDGMVNSFCPTISEAVRCNIDIKFMASGDAAKSVLYYITDYMTKTGNKSHVSFSALEIALKKLGDYDPADNDTELRAKKMLQKCVYAVLSHQELSGQQVAAYLKGYGDHYSSHKYRNLYWTAFERSVDADDPSPECYCRQQDTDSAGRLPTEQEDPTLSSEEVDDDSEPDELPDDNVNALSLSHEGGDEDVTIAGTHDGNIVQCSSQVHDYRLRAPALSHLSVWQFISCVDKVSKRTSQQRVYRNHGVDGMDSGGDDQGQGESDGDDDDEESDADRHEDYTHEDYTDTDDVVLCSRRGKRSLTFQLHPEHMQSHKKSQRLRSDPSTYLIPVPIGPALPRRDPGPLHAKYCRLMLILFKPWRVAGDLRDGGETWIEAFDRFIRVCTKGTKRILDNMQVLHECKDAKDIEDRRRRDGRRRNIIQSGWELTENDIEELAGEIDNDDLLEHLDSVVNYAADRRLRTDADVIECLNEIEQSGLLSPNESPIELQQLATGAQDPIDEIILPDNLPLEDMWKTAYENRRSTWKQKLCTPPDPTPIVPPPEVNPHISSFDTTTPLLPIATSWETNPQPQQTPVVIEDIATKWTLNVEQTRAFSLIASHSQKKIGAEPLRLYIGGPGGTGKSRVIAALADYFEINGETRRLRLASFTGIAAKNINGTTLHTALALNQGQNSRNKGKGKTKADLIAMWLGVDYLLVDEISMIGCNLLHQIHEALVEAKGCTEPFGGVSVIFAGDFAQLPPVGQTKLFSRTKSRKEAIIFGQLLWRSVTTVVMLTQQMRQAGPENERFVGMLSRLRDGRCTQDDYDVLNARLLSTVLKSNDASRLDWQSASMIVYTNAIKDAINLEATMAFARRTNQQVHWYHAQDTYLGKPIKDVAICDLLDELPSNKTGGRIRALPLVLGMPVMITENFDVAGGIVNGSTSTLRKVRYRVVDDRRYLTSCIVELSSITADPLPNLPLNHVAVLPSEVEMKPFRHPKSGRSCTLRRHQVPLDAAFAITAHKAQGQTMKKVIVDLNSCVGTEAAYVMVSRCTSLEGLLVLRPFSLRKITAHRSQEARDEFHRLERLKVQTMVECGDDGIGRDDRPLDRKMLTTENTSEIAALFSKVGPSDIDHAAQLLSRIWVKSNGDNSMPVLLLSNNSTYDTT